MLNLRVRTNGQYVELYVEIYTATFSTGLLDEVEAAEMASKLISAAEDLLPATDDYDYILRELALCRKMLEDY